MKQTSNNKLNIFPSTVVIAKNYDPFSDKILAHPFVVWKRQGFDTTMKNNVYAFRLTTQTNNYADYKVPIKPSARNNLTDFSFACVDSITLLNVDTCRIIGQLDADDFNNVITARINQEAKELEEALHTLNNMQKYESIGRSIQDKNNDKKLIGKY